MKGKRHIWTHPIMKYLVYPVLGSVFSYFIISGITALSAKVDILQGMGIVIKAIGKGIVAFLTFGVPVWVLLIVIGLAILITRGFLYFRKLGEVEERNSFRAYTKDEIKGHFFVWGYRSDGMPIDIIPVCKCGCILSKHDPMHGVAGYERYLQCPQCDERYPLVSLRYDDIRKIIVNKISNGNFRNTPFFEK